LKKSFTPKQARAFTELNTWHADFPLEEVPDILVGQTEASTEDTAKKGKTSKKAAKKEESEDASKLGKEERVEDMPDIRPAPRSALQALHRTAPSDKKRVVRVAAIPNKSSANHRRSMTSKCCSWANLTPR
jgi:hypothetical protein